MSQKRNSENIDLLAVDLRRRWEPIWSWGDVISAHLMLPHLRGFWPYGSIDENGAVYDISGQGRTLTNENAVSFEVTPTFTNTAVFDPALTQRLYRLTEPGLEIAGAITFGGWWWVNSIPGLGNIYHLMSKRGAAGNYGYSLYISDNSGVWTSLSDDGTNENISSGPTTISVGNWVHIVVRLEPGVKQTVWMNGRQGEWFVTVPASLFASTADFEIGSGNGGADYMDGRSALNFVCATNLADYHVESLFHVSMALFGVKQRG